MNLDGLIRTCAEGFLETEHAVNIDDIVQSVIDQYPDEIAENTDRLARNDLRRRTKRLLRDMHEEPGGGQSRLPGLNFPSVLAVPAENSDGYYYVRADKAVLAEVHGQRFLKEQNVTRAQTELDVYNEGVNAIEPIMESDPTMTVAEALRRLAG